VNLRVTPTAQVEPASPRRPAKIIPGRRTGECRGPPGGAPDCRYPTRRAYRLAAQEQVLGDRGEGGGRRGRGTSGFLYVKDVRKSMEFYNEVVGADIVQVHAEHENAPYSLAILRIGYFTLMLHPQEPHAQEFADTRVGVGIHLQLQVPDVD